MTFFSKPKSGRPPPPSLCDRCGLRPGVGSFPRLSRPTPPQATRHFATSGSAASAPPRSVARPATTSNAVCRVTATDHAA